MQGPDRQNRIALVVVTPMIWLSGPSTYDRTLSHVMHWEIPAIVSFYKYVGIRRVPGSFRSTDSIRHPIWSHVPLTDSPALDEINGDSRSGIGGNTRLRCTIRTLAMTSSAAHSYFCLSAQIDCYVADTHLPQHRTNPFLASGTKRCASPPSCPHCLSVDIGKV
jgi:hypothetical protein